MENALSNFYRGCAFPLVAGLLFSTPVFAVNDSFAISYSKTTGKATVTSSCCGTWVSSPQGVYGVLELVSTPAGTTKPANATKHVVEFEFNSPDFFVNNAGHLALFLRGDMYTVTANPNYPYRGHGLIIGNMGGWPDRLHPNGFTCTSAPSTAPITTVVEVAGSVPVGTGYVDNCVFGTQTAGIKLLGSPLYFYKVKLVSEYSSGSYTTSYILDECHAPLGISCGPWHTVANKTVSYPYPQLTSTLGGWFLAGVPDQTKDWTFNIKNLNARWE